MKRAFIAVALVIALVALWLALRTRRAAAPPPAVAPVTEAPATPASARASPEPRANAPTLAARAAARARRDAMRDEIVRAQAARQPHAASAAAPAGAGAAPAERPPGHLIDRVGGRDELLARLNHDLMPLIEECIEQAQARAPDLRGMLAIDLETVADEEVGAVVDSAGAAARNELADPELLECVRESALSLTLPAPPAGGRDKVMLTVPVTPP